MTRPPSSAARTKMLKAALELVLEHGVNAFSIDEVARRSGVAKTTIYRHFATKNELIVASLDGAIPIPAIPDTGSLRGDLLEFLSTVLPIFKDRTVTRLFFDIYAAAARDPELRKLQQSMMRGRALPTLTIFQRGQARGEISPNFDYPTAMEIMEGPFIIRSMFRPEALTDATLESLVERILTSLKGGL
jgi:AcrR family transcriptional regulator